MMDAFERIHADPPADVYWQVEAFYAFDCLAPYLEEDLSIFEFNTLVDRLSRLDTKQKAEFEDRIRQASQKGNLTTQELMTLAEIEELQPQREKEYMIRLTLTNHDDTQKQAILDMPATEEQMQEVMCQLDTPDWMGAQFSDLDSIVPQLKVILTDAEEIPRINELAQTLQELNDDGQISKCKAIVEATHCSTLDDVFDRIANLPQYSFEAKIRNKDILVRDELEFIVGGKEAELLYKHLNREAYAKDVLNQYSAKITPYGMVNRADFGPLNEPIREQDEHPFLEQEMEM